MQCCVQADCYPWIPGESHVSVGAGFQCTRAEEYAGNPAFLFPLLYMPGKYCFFIKQKKIEKYNFFMFRDKPRY